MESFLQEVVPMQSSEIEPGVGEGENPHLKYKFTSATNDGGVHFPGAVGTPSPGP
jgi:hypothetical protein